MHLFIQPGQELPGPFSFPNLKCERWKEIKVVSFIWPQILHGRSGLWFPGGVAGADSKVMYGLQNLGRIWLNMWPKTTGETVAQKHQPHVMVNLYLVVRRCCMPKIAGLQAFKCVFSSAMRTFQKL